MLYAIFRLNNFAVTALLISFFIGNLTVKVNAQASLGSEGQCNDYPPVVGNCKQWKDLGFCSTHEREMRLVCNQTCGYCDLSSLFSLSRTSAPMSAAKSAALIGSNAPLAGKEQLDDKSSGASQLSTEKGNTLESTMIKGSIHAGDLPTPTVNTLAPITTMRISPQSETNHIDSQAHTGKVHDHGQTNLTTQSPSNKVSMKQTGSLPHQHNNTVDGSRNIYNNRQSTTDQGNGYNSETPAHQKLTEFRLSTQEDAGMTNNFDKLEKQLYLSEGIFGNETKLGGFVKDVYEAIKQDNARIKKFSDEKAFGRLFKALYFAVLRKKEKEKFSNRTPFVSMVSTNESIIKGLVKNEGNYLHERPRVAQNNFQQTKKGGFAGKNISTLNNFMSSGAMKFGEGVVIITGKQIGEDKQTGTRTDMNAPITLGKSSVQIEGSFNNKEPDNTVENDPHVVSTVERKKLEVLKKKLSKSLLDEKKPGTNTNKDWAFAIQNLPAPAVLWKKLSDLLKALKSSTRRPETSSFPAKEKIIKLRQAKGHRRVAGKVSPANWQRQQTQTQNNEYKILKLLFNIPEKIPKI